MIGQPSTSEFEGGIGAQEVEIVAVLIAAGDRQHARSQHILDRVRDVRGIARSEIRAASVLARVRRRSARASSMTPLSEESRPPSNAAVTFLRDTSLARRRRDGCLRS